MGPEGRRFESCLPDNNFIMRSWKPSLDFYNGLEQVSNQRKDQAQRISDTIDLNHLKAIEVIETGASQSFDDGCFGLLFAHLAKEHGGKFSSIDVDEGISSRSIQLYKDHLPDFDELVNLTMDSVDFLMSYEGSPTIVHLDSWDFDIYNPEPSMLHTFLEFKAIEEKMEEGSYIIIDDNFVRGTFIYWNIFSGGEVVGKREFEVEHEIFGKGSLIYHYCKRKESNWEIVSDLFEEGPHRYTNQKLVIRKNW